MLSRPGAAVKNLFSVGCICCSLNEKLLQSLATILEEEKPDRIYIEATGLAVPWDMKESIETSFSSSRLQKDNIVQLSSGRKAG